MIVPFSQGRRIMQEACPFLEALYQDPVVPLSILLSPSTAHRHGHKRCSTRDLSCCSF